MGNAERRQAWEGNGTFVKGQSGRERVSQAGLQLATKATSPAACRITGSSGPQAPSIPSRLTGLTGHQGNHLQLRFHSPLAVKDAHKCHCPTTRRQTSWGEFVISISSLRVHGISNLPEGTCTLTLSERSSSSSCSSTKTFPSEA
jgi:hypothetical protein